MIRSTAQVVPIGLMVGLLATVPLASAQIIDGKCSWTACVDVDWDDDDVNSYHYSRPVSELAGPFPGEGRLRVDLQTDLCTFGRLEVCHNFVGDTCGDAEGFTATKDPAVNDIYIDSVTDVVTGPPCLDVDPCLSSTASDPFLDPC